ncbi:MAG TPA: ribosome small subunit-dependent GTPase A [Verrucomicrobiota bacterium]|nr:ribosome small subunit-dependent GTPase A [Verrucomicrobiales bacterium]HRI14942.1 ribosome small subunit-dependent GTPase A [Verrucomicrobiota bacterium]
MDLSYLGWSGCFAEAFSSLNDPRLVPARVASEDRHSYFVVAAAGEFTATVAGRLLHRTPSPTALPKVGDWVAVQCLPGEEKAIIQHVLPRKTWLGRRQTGRANEQQVLVANVDTAFVVQALDATFKVRRLERFLVMAREGGIRPIVVLNKADLGADLDHLTAEAHAAAGEALVVVTSAKTRLGIKALAAMIRPAETVVFVGTSGVGKSSLINRLCGEEIQPTLEVRESDSKGRHATTWRELIPLPDGGLVIDTPGMREFHLWLADEGVDDTFPEVVALATGCRFRDCQHEREPGCAVRAAVESGALTRVRHDAFLKLQRELSYLGQQRREHTYLARKREGKVAQRALERFYRDSAGSD